MSKPEFRLAKVLKEMHRGAVQNEVDTTLSTLIAAVREQGRGGTLTLKLEVKPNGGNEANIFATVTSNVPKPKARPALFYMTADNDLSREDPEQAEMFTEQPPVPENVRRMPTQAQTNPPPALPASHAV